MTETIRGMDLETSTVVLAGRTFPASLAVCPAAEGDNDPEVSRCLGVTNKGEPIWCYVPAENGLLFCVEEMGGAGGLHFSLYARTCKLDVTHGEPLWIPHMMGLCDGEIVAARGRSGVVWDWRHADEEWVVETIERLSNKPFTAPPGPTVDLVRLDHFIR